MQTTNRSSIVLPLTFKISVTSSGAVSKNTVSLSDRVTAEVFEKIGKLLSLSGFAAQDGKVTIFLLNGWQKTEPRKYGVSAEAIDLLFNGRVYLTIVKMQPESTSYVLLGKQLPTNLWATIMQNLK